MKLEWTGDIDAVFFDMDGTLLDSEPLTEIAISQLLHRFGITDTLDVTQFHGVTWKSIAKTICALYPELSDVQVANELSISFHSALVSNLPPPILGAPQAVKAIAQHVKTAVVSSSHRTTIEHVVESLGLNPYIQIVVGAEDVQYSKPNPQCFQMAANRIGVSYERCLVFEDSLAGLKSAKVAGMYTIGIGHSEEKELFADMIISNFFDLPDEFFSSLGGK